MYVPAGADEILAMDLKTGAVKRKYDADLDQSISTACCGWNNRGVAIGDGLVYAAQLDGKVVALDMMTGKVAWTTQVAGWQDGDTMTAVPLHHDGRIIVGLAGGEFGIRGRVEALDAKTGGEAWRFYTIPDVTTTSGTTTVPRRRSSTTPTWTGRSSAASPSRRTPTGPSGGDNWPPAGHQTINGS